MLEETEACRKDVGPQPHPRFRRKIWRVMLEAGLREHLVDTDPENF